MPMMNEINKHSESSTSTDTEWSPFIVTSIFNQISRGKRLKKADQIPGHVPYVSSTANNNGIDDFIEASAGTRVFRNCISLANSGSVGTAFYEPFSFVASDHVTALKTAQSSEHEYLFMATMIAKQKSNFNFNREINDIRIRNMRIMLPIDSSGSPDSAYMSAYVKQKQKTMLLKYREFVSTQLDMLGESHALPALNQKEWESFFLGDLFKIRPGKRLENRNKRTGSLPFIGASDSGNGVTGFIGNINKSLDGNVLGVNYNGMPCVAFYHPYECLFSDDVKRLHLLHHKDDPFVYLFFATLFTQQKSKYAYGYKFNTRRMLRQKLMVPITGSGAPDYEYMKEYAKNMMRNKYKQYIDFLDLQGCRDRA